ncbi:MAG TPA: hypothetical protein PKZ42_07665 [Syntrophales bacterium]|nr:hypothetical protein [Syntrophales bacterium]
MTIQSTEPHVICVKCQEPLKPGKATFNYLGNTFTADLLKCPKCGLVFVPEELAKGRMLEVEQNLEDK